MSQLSCLGNPSFPLASVEPFKKSQVCLLPPSPGKGLMLTVHPASIHPQGSALELDTVVFLAPPLGPGKHSREHWHGSDLMGK